MRHRTGEPRRRRTLTAAVAALAALVLSGCSGSLLFPLSATMPASWGQAYAEVKGQDPVSAQLSEPARLFLSGLDPLAAKPVMPAKPTKPRPSRLAAEPFPLAALRMGARPGAGTACAAIAAAVGGAKARCGFPGDAELNGELPAGAPAEAFIIGKAYSDGRMVLLDRPGEGASMWDAAMHERGHLIATWLCGQADCLDAMLVARGHPPERDYLQSLLEGFAQSWAQCQGAERRPEYRQLPCSDVRAVVDAAQTEKKAAQADFEAQKEQYAAELTTYRDKLRNYDRLSTELDVLTRFAARVNTSTLAS